MSVSRIGGTQRGPSWGAVAMTAIWLAFFAYVLWLFFGGR